ncbi:MAG: aromatic ring-hydroxylating dioxygenase subunit alpha [Rubrivivax sp.]|nr:aromatic ring-hydroxylating dioxygenase subunit alpha [Rubrivivax sp.]
MDASISWGESPTSRAPGWVYTDHEIYREELERFFYRGHWCYVGLSCEVPAPGDFRRSAVGERSVIMVRDKDGAIRVVENRCAHRGVAFCRERHGHVDGFTCPYHQWNYNLKGELVGLPFRRGVKAEGGVQGGMPADFKLAEHGLTQLRVAERGGAVFASFDADVEPFEDYVGPEVLRYVDRVFHGRELKLLGYSRQRIPANWKLMQENIKDPYHPGLLHTWFVTFGLWRADQRSQMVMDAKHRHASMVSRRNEGGAGSVTQGVSSFRADMKLHDDRLLDVVPEPWWDGPTVVMTTLFPSVIIQQQVNSLSTRHLLPSGPGQFDFVWTHFGFADDDAAMTRRRLRQANLFGPAGFVSADDGEVIEFVQQAFEANPEARTISELDGRDVRPTDHMVTETLIRGMYGYWREVMGR